MRPIAVGRRYIQALPGFATAQQKHYPFTSLLAKVDSITRPKVDTKLKYPCANPLTSPTVPNSRRTAARVTFAAA